MKCYEEYCGYQNCNHECCHPYIREWSILCPETKKFINKDDSDYKKEGE